MLQTTLKYETAAEHFGSKIIARDFSTEIPVKLRASLQNALAFALDLDIIPFLEKERLRGFTPLHSMNAGSEIGNLEWASLFLFASHRTEWDMARIANINISSQSLKHDVDAPEIITSRVKADNLLQFPILDLSLLQVELLLDEGGELTEAIVRVRSNPGSDQQQDPFSTVVWEKVTNSLQIKNYDGVEVFDILGLDTEIALPPHAFTLIHALAAGDLFGFDSKKEVVEYINALKNTP